MAVFVTSCNGQKSLSNKQAPPVNTDLNILKFTVQEAKDWSELFLRKSGWFGGDGIFAIPQDGVDSSGAAKNQETVTKRRNAKAELRVANGDHSNPARYYVARRPLQSLSHQPRRNIIISLLR